MQPIIASTARDTIREDKMTQKSLIRKILKIVLPFILGGAILYWMYREVDFHAMWQFMEREMNWTWMWLSFPFGILAQMFRGWRWHLMLDPIGEKSRTSTSVNSIFLSYAVSLAIPRVGEFMRCGVLNKYDGVSFPKALGTVVIERAVDSIIVLVITVATLLLQMQVFGIFFEKTGVNVSDILQGFSLTGYLVTAICGIAALCGLYFVRRKLSFYDKVKSTLQGICEGVLSLKHVKNIPLFLFYSIMIWVSYFLHYYLTFFCFDFTADLGIMSALVTFIVGSIAVIVPTPNGMGPWHFAVKTMLILYGIADINALYFVLIVHTVQTLLVVALGIYAAVALSLQKQFSVNS